MTEARRGTRSADAETPRWIVADDLATAGAKVLVSALRAADAERRFPLVRLGIPGGSALAAAVLARAALADPDDTLWARVALVLVDERRVAADDPASNFGAARRAGLFARGEPALVLRLVLDGEPIDDALARVQATFDDAFGGALDVVLLGLGPDGHVASLFPGLPWPRGVVGFVANAPKPPPERLTLSREALATARTTVIVAGGSDKRQALRRLAANDPTLPAVGLPGLVVVTDLNDLNDVNGLNDRNRQTQEQTP